MGLSYDGGSMAYNLIIKNGQVMEGAGNSVVSCRYRDQQWQNRGDWALERFLQSSY
jgi:hypothetical protein